MADEANKVEERIDDEEQFVVFRVADEEYGVPIDAVQEIVRSTGSFDARSQRAVLRRGRDQPARRRAAGHRPAATVSRCRIWSTTIASGSWCSWCMAFAPDSSSISCLRF